MRDCPRCGEPTIFLPCVYCSGDRQRQPQKQMTEAEWREGVAVASEKAQMFVKLAEKTMGPEEAVLALMLAAATLVETIPQLPHFDWYVKRVVELIAETKAANQKPS